MLVTIATEPAAPNTPNEDFVVATPQEVVVIDGAGSAGTPSGCMHGVSWYVRQLGRSLIGRLAIREGAGLTEILADAIREVAYAHCSTCDLSHPGTPSAAVVLLRERPPQLEYLVLADSTVILARGQEVAAICDDREATASRKLRDALDASPNGTPEHDVALRQFIRDMQSLRNRPGGFWVAAADPEAAHEALTGNTRLDGLTAAAALTDGAARLVDRFNVTDWPGFLEIAAREGPAEIIRRTRAVEHSDPAGRRWKRGKATDDASIAYCTKFAATTYAHDQATWATIGPTSMDDA